MKQIDLMVAHKKAEWEGQAQALEACLSAREQELASARAALQAAQKEAASLHQQLQDVERGKQDMAREYQQQLGRLQEELSRLRRSYEKLQKKHLREARGEGSKSQGEEQLEVRHLSRKLEEFRQRALGWEQQRRLYQQQLASLEAQRKALAEQSELIQQTQVASGKQALESVELASCSHIQHLTGRLERANDAICANQLEVERLNIRVDDLTESNQMALEDQQRVQEELRQSKKMLEVLEEEKMELRATLQSQEDFIESSKLHQEQLQKELARVTETLHTKELLIRALEERLQEQLSKAGMQRVLEQLAAAQEKEQHLQSELMHLENSLLSSTARCAELSEELDGSTQELQALQEHRAQAKAELRKLKEQLSRAEQIHKSELEGMKREICRLTEELHRRDVSVGAAGGCRPAREQPRAERAERRAAEHRGREVTLRAPSGDSAAELNRLKSENQQLQKELAEARAKLELTQQACQDEAQGPAQQMQDEARDGQCRTTQDPQHEQEQQAERAHHKPEENGQHQHGGAQEWEAAGMRSVSPEVGELQSQSSRRDCREPLAVGTLLGTDSVLHVLEGKKDSAEEAAVQPGSQHQRASVPLSPLPRASLGAIAARYLEEEELRSQSITQCLESHIEELKKASEEIVRQFRQQ
ncbi:centrosomal protein of 63 kDa [Dryobates pubescens]|uniref:centrosomal protein of 63 kDa n=1 Tax=Dryobates pubescens TaxID=118200 RepID=UPI0023B909A7|nr:centrosomal protein of 63 kDa [Dryobates pubescens]